MGSPALETSRRPDGVNLEADKEIGGSLNSGIEADFDQIWCTMGKHYWAEA